MSLFTCPAAAMRGAAAASGIPTTHAAVFSVGSEYYRYATWPDNATFTYEFWVKWNSLPGVGSFNAVWDRWTATPRSSLIRIFNVGGVITPAIFGSISPGTATSFRAEWATGITTGIWYHLAFSYDSSLVLSSAAKFRLNGIDQGAPTVVTGSGSTNYPLNVEASKQILIAGQIGSGNIVGLIDDIRVWTVARSAAEILANKGTSMVGNETNLKSMWKLDNNPNDSNASARHLIPEGPVITYSGADLPF